MKRTEIIDTGDISITVLSIKWQYQVFTNHEYIAQKYKIRQMKWGMLEWLQGSSNDISYINSDTNIDYSV